MFPHISRVTGESLRPDKYSLVTRKYIRESYFEPFYFKYKEDCRVVIPETFAHSVTRFVYNVSVNEFDV